MCEPVWVIHDAFLDFGMKLWHALIIERNLATDQNIKNDTEAPNVNLRARVLSCLQKFWRGEVEASTESFETVARREKIAQPEVNDFDVSSFADKNVLNLQVPMHDTISVTVVQRARNLAAEFAGLFLFQFPVRDDVVEHLTTIDILEEHIPMIVRPLDIPHRADVGMIQEGDNGGFPGRTNLLRVIRPLTLTIATMLVCRLSRHNLYGHLLPSLQILGQFDFAHAPRADGLSQLPLPRLRGNRCPFLCHGPARCSLVMR